MEHQGCMNLEPYIYYTSFKLCVKSGKQPGSKSHRGGRGSGPIPRSMSWRLLFRIAFRHHAGLTADALVQGICCLRYVPLIPRTEVINSTSTETHVDVARIYPRPVAYDGRVDGLTFTGDGLRILVVSRRQVMLVISSSFRPKLGARLRPSMVAWYLGRPLPSLLSTCMEVSFPKGVDQSVFETGFCIPP